MGRKRRGGEGRKESMIVDTRAVLWAVPLIEIDELKLPV